MCIHIVHIFTFLLSVCFSVFPLFSLPINIHLTLCNARDWSNFSYISIGPRKQKFNHSVYMLMEACEGQNETSLHVFIVCGCISILIYM